MKETSDSDLMRQVRGGRTVALATLFERHHTRVYGYCLRMTGNRAAAEDLVQDVFMKMLKYKATFKDDSELVRQALLRLPAERREVLVLSRYEYKSYDEIARVLDCSVGAVKVRVHRAMKQLREIYLDMAGEVSA